MSRGGWRICEFCGSVNRVRGRVCPTCYAKGTLLYGDRPPIPVVKGGPPARDRLFEALLERLQWRTLSIWDWRVERAGRRCVHVTRRLREVPYALGIYGTLAALLALVVFWYVNGPVLGVLAAALGVAVYGTYKRLQATGHAWCPIMVTDDGRAVFLDPDTIDSLDAVRETVERVGLRVEAYPHTRRSDEDVQEGAVAR